MSDDARAIQRLHVNVQTVVPRPLEAVWAEHDSGDHPAWGDPAWQATPLAGPSGRVVGAGNVAVIPARGQLGLRSVWLSRVIAVMPGYSVTVETLNGTLEQVETIRFLDAGEGATRLELDSYITTVISPSRVPEMTVRFGDMAQAYIDRVADWRPPA